MERDPTDVGAKYTNGHLTQQRGYVSGIQEVEQNFAFTTGLWTGFDQKLFTGGVKTVTRTNDTFFRLTNVTAARAPS